MDAGQIKTWREASDRGLRWLSSLVDMEPPLGPEARDLNWFAKLPWTLAACGERLRALRVLRHVQHRFLETGTLHDVAQIQWTNSPAYGLGWIIPGARLSEAHDLARLLYEQFRPYVCPTTGGVVGKREQKNDPDAWFDLALQGAALHAGVAVGDMDMARHAGRFMIDAIRRQPEPKRRFYLYYHPARGHLREFDDTNRMQRVLFADAPKQVLANLGFGLHGLLRVFEATGEQVFQDAAREVVDLLLDHYQPDWLTYSQNHKVAHVAVLLYRQTGQPRYRDAAVSIAGRIAERLTADGRALADLMFDSVEKQTQTLSTRTTCDSVIWLSGICDELENLQ